MRREKTQINKIRNEKEEITTNTKDIQGLIKNYFENVYSNKLGNLKEMDNGEKLKPFPVKSGMRQRCPFSPLFFNSLGIPKKQWEYQSNKTGRKNKRNANWKGRSQTIPICR
jgi:hypothetical protein